MWVCRWRYSDEYSIYNYLSWILIGLGLKPELCGQGLGSKLMEIIKKQCFKKFPNKKL